MKKRGNWGNGMKGVAWRGNSEKREEASDSDDNCANCESEATLRNLPIFPTANFHYSMN